MRPFSTLVLLELSAAALLFAAPLFVSAQPATDVRRYVPLAPISYTIENADTKDCEGKLAQVTRLSQTDRRSPDYDNALQGYKNACGTSLPEYLRGIYFGGVLLAGFLAVFAIVRAGFTLLFTDSILGHSEAKGMILKALGGLMIVYMSYMLMNTINPQLGTELNLSLDFPTVKVQKGALNSFMQAGSQQAISQAMARYGSPVDEVNVTISENNGKVRALKSTREALEKQLEEGQYADRAAGEALVQQIGTLRAQESALKGFTEGTATIALEQVKMIDCLSGQRPCNQYGTTAKIRDASTTRTAADIARDNQEADRYLANLRTTVAQKASVLEAAGRTAEATALRAQLTKTEALNTFWRACPSARTYSSTWRPGAACP